MSNHYTILLGNTLCCFRDCSPDADPRPWGPCVVDEMNKFTQTAEVLWRKRGVMATLYVREGPDPCLGKLLLLFWAH